jgi:DNA-binding HxlR family transcriptional regulator
LPPREVIKRIGDKWSVLVVSLLGDGPKRFSELKRTVEGVSQRMLTHTLRGLERDGIISRTVFPSVPPRVDYELTLLGKTLHEPVFALALWANDHRAQMQEARDHYDRKEAKRKAIPGR